MQSRSSVSRREAITAGVCLCCLPAALRSAHAGGNGLRTEEIAPGIHIRRGVDEDAAPENHDAIANIGFIIGREAVAVTDPGGSLADGERLRARIQALTPLPIRYVLMSHVHPDHIFGAGAFVEDRPEFVGHALLPEALAQRGEYYREGLERVLGPGRAGPVVQPTMLVRDRASIDLGGRVLEVQAHGIAHTNCDLSMLDRQTQTLFPADLLFVRRVPSLDGSLKGWLKALAALEALGVERAVPGHGPASVDFSSAASALERYLQTLLRETRQAIAAGMQIDAAPGAIAQSERGKWALFDAYHGRNVTQAFKELEWE